MMIGGHAQGPMAGHLDETSQEPSGCRPVAMLAEHRVEKLTIAINRSVQVAPPSGDFHYVSSRYQDRRRDQDGASEDRR